MASNPSPVVIYGSSCITEKPYSTLIVTTRVQTLADGTHVTVVSKVFKARDSQGRTVEESYRPEHGNSDQSAPVPFFIAIQDGVSGHLIHISPQSKRASISTYFTCVAPHADVKRIPPQIQRPLTGGESSRSQIPATESRPLFQVEGLGGDTIYGIFAEGTRTTQIVPAGTQGNDRDITTVTEHWFSPDLMIDVRTIVSDPRIGEITTEIRDLNRDEPAPELFQIPAGYKITHQTN